MTRPHDYGWDPPEIPSGSFSEDIEYQLCDENGTDTDKISFHAQVEWEGSSIESCKLTLSSEDEKKLVANGYDRKEVEKEIRKIVGLIFLDRTTPDDSFDGEEK